MPINIQLKDWTVNIVGKLKIGRTRKLLFIFILLTIKKKQKENTEQENGQENPTQIPVY